MEPLDFVEEEGAGSRFFRWATGEKARVYPMVNPYGVTTDGAGRIWVSDPGFGAVHLFDLARQRIEYIFTAGDESLVSPAGLFFDKNSGSLYVSDSILGKVFILDSDHRLVGTRQPAGGFGRPAGLALDGEGRLHVADVLKNTVEVFAPDGRHLESLESAFPEEIAFNRPVDLAVDDSGRLFVVDSMNFRVEAFGPDRETLGTIGEIGNVPGTFARPRGIALDSQGHIYVADATFDNIQIFNRNGRLLLYFGQKGEGAGEFSLPAMLCFDDEDRLYVVDAYNKRVQVFQYLRGEGDG